MIRTSDQSGQQTLSLADESCGVRELAVAERALDLWLCWHAASPHEVIPSILRELADGELSDDQVKAISKAASDWTRKRHTYHPSDTVIITAIAAREAQK
jgi:hypothetical protein